MFLQRCGFSSSPDLFCSPLTHHRVKSDGFIETSSPQIPGHQGEEDPFLLPGTRNARPRASETFTATLKGAGCRNGFMESAGQHLDHSPDLGGEVFYPQLDVHI